MSAEAQVRYSQFDEESSNDTYELDDDEFDLDSLDAEDLELTDDAELIEIDALDIIDKEFSGDASIKKDWGELEPQGRHRRQAQAAYVRPDDRRRSQRR